MKRVGIIFVLAVFGPSLVLAGLALRSLRDQQYVLERQQSLLYQRVAESLVSAVTAFLTDRQRDFALQVEAILGGHDPYEVADYFDTHLLKIWPLAEVGFAVSLDGRMYAPSLLGSPLARKFRLENERFLCNRESVEVYANTPKGQINLTQLEE